LIIRWWDKIGATGNVVAIGVIRIFVVENGLVGNRFDEAKSDHKRAAAFGKSGDAGRQLFGGIAGYGTVLQLRAALREHVIKTVWRHFAKAPQIGRRMGAAFTGVAALTRGLVENWPQSRLRRKRLAKRFIAGEMRAHLGLGESLNWRVENFIVLWRLRQQDIARSDQQRGHRHDGRKNSS
jgi:hypothetical protein